MPKRTYQASKKKRKRKFGFRTRGKSPGWRRVVARRRRKGRRILSF